MSEIDKYVIIAGVNKAGTTSLFTYLSQHPEICSSSIKETCYFLPIRYGKELQPFDVYKKYFNNCESKAYYLESTPGYFYGGSQLAGAIQKKLPKTKIIISLRDPISRMLSFYHFKKNQLELPSDLSFQEYFNLCKTYNKSDFSAQHLNPYFGLEGGKYIDYISDWEMFSSEDILIIDFGFIKSNPILCLQNICKWLDIDTSFYSSYNFKIENKSVGVKNKKLQKIALNANNIFESFFRKNKKLKNVIRNLYYIINGTSAKDKIDESVINELEKFYEPYNKKLLNYFKENMKIEIPGWLSKIDDVKIT